MTDINVKALRQPTSQLFLSADGPYCSVRVVRQAWLRPSGKLDTLSIEGPAKLCRRALDKLFNPELIAVGQLKAWLETYNSPGQWVLEMHLIAFGATSEDLEKAFEVRSRRTSSVIGNVIRNVIRIDEVTDLSKAVRRLLSAPKVRAWKGLWSEGDPEPLKPAQSAGLEFDLWQAALKPEAGIFRYGCDRYLKPLKKRPRVVKPPKPKKKHPDPIWLERHQFGNE